MLLEQGVEGAGAGGRSDACLADLMASSCCSSAYVTFCSTRCRQKAARSLEGPPAAVTGEGGSCPRVVVCRGQGHLVLVGEGNDGEGAEFIAHVAVELQQASQGEQGSGATGRETKTR